MYILALSRSGTNNVTFCPSLDASHNFVFLLLLYFDKLDTINDMNELDKLQEQNATLVYIKSL
jgi:hypothetical protein